MRQFEIRRTFQDRHLVRLGLCLAFLLPATGATAAPRTVVPRGTVVQVKLLQDLSSKAARVGDRVRVEVTGEDQSGLPEGAVLVGRVTEVHRATDSRPGTLDLSFGALSLRRGWQPISGDLYSLSDSDVRQTASGRLVAKKTSGDDTKFIGYGALGGVLLGKLLGTSTIKGVLLGAAAGYLYGRTQKDKYRDVDLNEGATFGVRLDRRVVLPADAMGI